MAGGPMFIVPQKRTINYKTMWMKKGGARVYRALAFDFNFKKLKSGFRFVP